MTAETAKTACGHQALNQAHCSLFLHKKYILAPPSRLSIKVTIFV
jgi:hypothetical protein